MGGDLADILMLSGGFVDGLSAAVAAMGNKDVMELRKCSKEDDIELPRVLVDGVAIWTV